MSTFKHYHLIGIGGAGMSGLARALHSNGHRVTGSDAAMSDTILHLNRELGAKLAIGNTADNLNGLEPNVVVYSAAVKSINPELAEAQRRNIPIISRADLLAELMAGFPTRIAVTGTHGKTTTTAMAAQMLKSSGMDPTALVGANVPEWKSNTLVGGHDMVVAEACEAFGSFLSIHPTHTIITNIEADHLDYYKTFDAVVAAFRQFASQTDNVVICCVEHGASDLIKDAANEKLITYGFTSGVYRAVEKQNGEFDVTKSGTAIGAVCLKVPGRHNILNALSVVALGQSLGISFDKIAFCLSQFRGTERRFETLGETKSGALVIDDYAHHPTEVKATLAAARAQFPGRRIVALFQPHLPSRTQELMDDFAGAFSDSDLTLITDIYLAREEPLAGVTSQELARRSALRHGNGKVTYAGALIDAADALRGEIRRGDVILTLGAGNVRQAGEALLEAKS